MGQPQLFPLPPSQMYAADSARAALEAQYAPRMREALHMGKWGSQGAIAEGWVRERLREHLARLGWRKQPHPRGEAWAGGTKTVVFSSEPDVEVRQEGRLIGAVEIKGGIDKAGVLERLGAAVKSLRRAKDEEPAAVTILLLTAASLTEQAKRDLHRQRQVVNRWYTLEQLLQDPQTWQTFLDDLRLSSS